MEERPKLLVVDDESDNLDLLYRTLRRDFQVFKADDAVQALDILDKLGEMAIIISDQRMPQMSGTEFLSRTVERFPDTIRILLTAYTDAGDLVAAINTGQVFKYITKPWHPQNLKDIVAQAAETYQIIKQRTRALSRALEQEFLINSMMSAVRGSLDYNSTLKTVVTTLGKAFKADWAVLHPAAYPAELWQSEESANPLLIYSPSRDCFVDISLPKQTGPHPSEFGKDPIFHGELAPFLASFSAPFPADSEIVSEQVTVEETVFSRLVVPFLDKGVPTATIALYKKIDLEANAQPDGQKALTSDVEGRKWVDNAIDMLKNVSEQVALAISHARLYQHVHRQSVQMRAELAVARKIQTNLLHQSWPEIPGIKIQARCQPAREIGGDFFEVFMHPQGDIWLAVGDVSGKGVPAALFMVSAMSVLRRELSKNRPLAPERMMHNLNANLADDLMNNNCFITMALIRYSPKTGQLVYANAGHVYPLVWSHQSMVTEGQKETASVKPAYLNVRGVPLGILPVWEASAGELELSQGDVILLVSDGITEATVPNGLAHGDRAMLKQAGLWKFLQQQPAQLDLDNLLDYIRLPDGEQEDDQTAVSLEVMPC
ncbi:MAG: SpoIIE family protein phosphatase [Phormidesmis sp.]